MAHAGVCPLSRCCVAFLIGYERGLFPLHHGEGDFLAVAVDLFYPYGYGIAYAHHVAGVLHEAIGEFRNVHKAVLVHADVDERTEIDHIAHGTFSSMPGSRSSMEAPSG